MCLQYLTELIPMKDTHIEQPINDETRELMRIKEELLQVNEQKNEQMLTIIRNLRLMIKDINIDAPLKPEPR